MDEVSVAHATTALFVPGDRPERFAKAVASGADLVIVDLEDAVAPDAKGIARVHLARALGSSLRVAVRINALQEGGRADLEALARVSESGRLRAVMLPKAESAEDIAALGDALGPDVAIIALVETVKGLKRAHEVAHAPGVARLAFGALDFAVDADATSSILLDHARCEIVLVSRYAELAAPLESPHPELRDLEAVGLAARRSRTLGFGGQLCIHPAQVPAVSAAFLPTSDEVEWASRILESAAGGVTQVDGAMVDRPVRLRAQSILARVS